MDDVHLAQVRGKAQAVELRSGRESATNVPGISGAAQRSVNQVQRVRDWVQHHARPAENARALAYRTGRTLLVAVQLKEVFALSIHLPCAFFQDVHDGLLRACYHIACSISGIRSLTVAARMRFRSRAR